MRIKLALLCRTGRILYRQEQREVMDLGPLVCGLLGLIAVRLSVAGMHQTTRDSSVQEISLSITARRRRK